MEKSLAKTNVDKWVDHELSNQHKLKAIENASRNFDENDRLSVHLLESIYGQESSFGEYRRNRNIIGAAGDFQIEKQTAEDYGLTVNERNDQRFDIDDAADVAARYLKDLDKIFSNETELTPTLTSTPVKDANERKKLVIAAYNAGQGRIAKAQIEALKDGKNPELWEDVKDYLGKAGASPEKIKEILDYVEKILKYEEEFRKKSKANPNVKNKNPLKHSESDSSLGRWITKNGVHIYI